MRRVRLVIVALIVLGVGVGVAVERGTGVSSRSSRSRPPSVVPSTSPAATSPPAPTAAGSTPLLGTDANEPPASAVACGTERWDVKTGADAAARDVNPAAVHDTTVVAMDGFSRPSDPTTRVAPVEMTVYRVRATLTSFKLEDDRDLHLVLSDGAGHTMIAEIPSPACDAGSVFGAQIAAARSAFDARHREEPHFVRDGEEVTVVGVGFFDFDHGQRGVAPNAVELHPVLSISFG